MIAELLLDEQANIDSLKDCILFLQSGLEGLVVRASAQGWDLGEIANALAFLAIMKQWEAKETKGAAGSAGTSPSDSMH